MNLTNEKHLSTEESLAIITRMIQNTHHNVSQNSFYFLLWGWVTVIGNLVHFYLMEFTTFDQPYLVWLITIPAWIVSLLYGYRKSNQKTVKTYGDGLILWIWVAFSICLMIIVFSGQFGSQIPALILLFAGFAAFMTGLVLKFRPLILGGSSFWIFSAIAFAVSPSYSLLVSAVAIAVGYLVPGYLLKKS